MIAELFEKALFFAEGLEAGMVQVNNASTDAESYVPFGGCKGSGQAREGGGGRYSIEEMTEVKWVTIQKAKKQFPIYRAVECVTTSDFLWYNKDGGVPFKKVNCPF
jgi:vanillin dehydrogenase